MKPSIDEYVESNRYGSVAAGDLVPALAESISNSLLYKSEIKTRPIGGETISKIQELQRLVQRGTFIGTSRSAHLISKTAAELRELPRDQYMDVLGSLSERPNDLFDILSACVLNRLGIKDWAGPRSNVNFSDAHVDKTLLKRFVCETQDAKADIRGALDQVWNVIETEDLTFVKSLEVNAIASFFVKHEQAAGQAASVTVSTEQLAPLDKTEAQVENDPILKPLPLQRKSTGFLSRLIPLTQVALDIVCPVV